MVAIGAIGLLNEFTIHRQLKAVYRGENDAVEQELDGYIIDIVTKTRLVEIQTKNFLKIRTKLKKLLDHHDVLLVHNIPVVKWLIKTDACGALIAKRKSPKKGNLYHLFDELIYLADVVAHPRFALDIVFTEEEELRRDDGKGSWRRQGVSILDRRLVDIVTTKRISAPGEYLALLPENLPEPFSTKDISRELGINGNLARKVGYFFRKAALVRCVAKKGNLLLYEKNTD